MTAVIKKTVEENLLQSENLYRLLAEASPEMIYLIDAEFRVRYVNPAALAMFGTGLDNIVGKHVKEIYPADVAERHIKALTHVITSGERFETELLETFPSGRMWIDARLSPVRTVDGQITGVLGLSQDITARKKAEEALRDSEERFRTLFEEANFGMALSGLDSRFIDANKSFCRMMGYTVEELQKMTFKELTHPDHLAQDMEEVRKIMKGESSSYRTQKKYLRKDGVVIWGDLHLSVVRGESGRLINILVILEDITAQRKMEAELIQAQKLEALGVLAGGIAHDFNNLLTNLFGFWDLALKELKQDEPAERYLRKAYSALEHGKNLSRHILTFSKGGAPEKKTLDLERLLKESCDLALSGTNIKYVKRSSDRPLVVEADEHQLMQVFSNILINARQSMAEDGVVVVESGIRTIWPESPVPLPPGSYAFATIEDNGHGIHDNVIGRIFDPFFSTKQHGSGLGLSISYSIVKRHQGHIQASSIPGKGSVFTVYLPLSSEKSPAARETGDGESFEGKGRILVMDDDANIREVTSTILRYAGYEVTTASEGAETVKKYAAALDAGTPFDMVLLDLTVVDGKGGEWTWAELKKLDPSVKVCVSSGYSDNPVLVDPESYGFKGKIAKPYRANDLLRVVKQTMGKSE